ncbi:hypothetical protein L1049_013958 [Liquidambar formosana]|uniref:HMA domain-containing protein n=1 Tax=Liquidambar formosana TaxID=63359 RepID=A0AAP0WZ74_LIQFO
MKRMDLFCASQASTAICSSMEQRSMVRHGTRPIDRRRSRQPVVPCSSSQLPFNPKPYYQKSRKSSAKENDQRRKGSADKADQLTSPPGSSRYLLSDTPFFELLSDSDQFSALVPTGEPAMARQLGSNDSLALKPVVPTQPAASQRQLRLTNSPAALKSSSSTRSQQLSSYDSPALKSPSSTRSRQLSSKDSPSLKSFSSTRSRPLGSNDSPALKSALSTRSRDQVVVLRVSLHCKGCEGKVRKHISRMEGVTSFSIDLETKKVTVIGDVTPLGVLESVSRVKNAQLWPSSSPSSSMVRLS